MLDDVLLSAFFNSSLPFICCQICSISHRDCPHWRWLCPVSSALHLGLMGIPDAKWGRFLSDAEVAEWSLVTHGMGFYPSSYLLKLSSSFLYKLYLNRWLLVWHIWLMKRQWGGNGEFYKPSLSWSHCIGLSCDGLWERLAVHGCFHGLPQKVKVYSLLFCSDMCNNLALLTLSSIHFVAFAPFLHHPHICTYFSTVWFEDSSWLLRLGNNPSLYFLTRCLWASLWCF